MGQMMIPKGYQSELNLHDTRVFDTSILETL